MNKRMSTEDRRKQITEAAIKIIGEQGLRAFTVAKVAEEVGIKDGSIFRHFKSKDEIVSSVIDTLEQVMSGTIPVDIENPLERLEAFFINRVSILTGRPGIRSLVFSDQLIHAGGDSGLKRIMVLREKARDYITSCLVEAANKKLINPELQIGNVIIVFQGMVMGLLFVGGDTGGEITTNKRIKQVWDTFLSMVKKDIS